MATETAGRARHARRPPARAATVTKTAPTNKVSVLVLHPDYGGPCKALRLRLARSVRSRVRLLEPAGWEAAIVDSVPGKERNVVLFVSRLADVPPRLPRDARAGTRTKFLLFAEELPIEAVAARLPGLHVRDARRLHVARGRDAEAASQLVMRVATGLASPDRPARIADAWIEIEQLVVLSPSFERMTVPLDKLPKRVGRSVRRAGEFEIDEDGSFLYWPRGDVHLGWAQLAQRIDPATAVEAQQGKKSFNQRYGAAIGAFRQEHGIRQSDVDGLTSRHLRRVERGELAVTRAVLSALAKAHGLLLEAYLEALAQQLADRSWTSS